MEIEEIMIVKLRFRSRTGKGQVKLRKIRKVRYLDLSYTLFLVLPVASHAFTCGLTCHHHKLFSWLLRGLDMSDGLRVGWCDSSKVRGGYNFKVIFKVAIK